MNVPTKLIAHHVGGTVLSTKADTSHHTAEIIDAWHRTRWPGFTSKVYKNNQGEFFHVGYHVVIEADGTIVHTRAYSEEGAHTVGMNNSSIGVCLTGNFDVMYPTKEQLESFKKLWKEIKTAFPSLTVYDIVPHRTYSTKSCFGSKLSDDYFKGIVMESLPETDRIKEMEEKEQRTVMFNLIETLQKLIAILTQQITDRRTKL